jgi:hypothetical protein
MKSAEVKRNVALLYFYAVHEGLEPESTTIRRLTILILDLVPQISIRTTTLL